MTSCTTQGVTERVSDDVSHVTVIAVTQTLGTTLSSWTIAHFPLHRVAAHHIRGSVLHRRSLAPDGLCAPFFNSLSRDWDKHFHHGVSSPRLQPSIAFVAVSGSRVISHLTICTIRVGTEIQKVQEQSRSAKYGSLTGLVMHWLIMQTQVMFVTWNGPAMYVAIQPVLSLCSSAMGL